MNIEKEKEYWNKRYASNKTSGGGSYGEEAEFKLKSINEFIIDKEKIRTIVDVGCGDFNIGSQFIKFFPNAKYLGLDVSNEIIKRHQKKYISDNLRFDVINENRGLIFFCPDILICFDMLFHVMDDETYNNILENLKKSWRNYLLIATYNDTRLDMPYDLNYIKKRKFDPKFFAEEWKEILIPFYDGNKSLYFFTK